MGYYIQGPTHGKDVHLVKTMGAQVIPKPTSFNAIPSDKALVVVVDNGIFDAAGLVYNQREFAEFTKEMDPRPRVYLLLDKNEAHKAANYKGEN